MKPADFDLMIMQRALAHAQQGQWSSRPNPMVGCILVKNGEIISEGLHWQAGKPHAECEALSQTDAALGATCYVTLEPCAHHGRTPPCVNALIEAGITRCVIACEDPNPRVAGRGIKALKEAGISVDVGLCKQEAKALNIGFFSRMQRRRPYVRAKIAMSLDGKVAMQSGESQWISNASSRLKGQAWRARSGAVITTQATMAQDNCRLTVRGEALPTSEQFNFVQPMRVVIDSHLKTAPSAQMMSEPGETYIAISNQVEDVRQSAWPHAGHLIAFPTLNGHVDFQEVLHWLGEREINDVLIEAGPTFVGAMLQANLIDELLVFIAPKLLGQNAVAMANLGPINALQDHLALAFKTVEILDGDIAITAKVSKFGEDHDNF
jgi:diaminohydroxyphosphoribosylaminopyrimidine deaminase/5-amino-6-(5-phosphoribosylamino)uracil reductase